MVLTVPKLEVERKQSVLFVAPFFCRNHWRVAGAWLAFTAARAVYVMIGTFAVIY